MTTLRNHILQVEINETNLAISVTDRRGQARWQTPGAGLELQAYDIGGQSYRWYPSRTATKTAGDLSWYAASALARCEIQLRERSRTQAVARVNYAGLELAFTIEFTLDGERLELFIPQASWDFTGEYANEVISLDCLPLFGGRPSGAKGYLVLPHCGGAIREFADRPDRAQRMATALVADPNAPYAHERAGNRADPRAPQSYCGMAYGLQTNWRDLIAYPLWGAVAGDSGWAAYVPFGCGDADAGIITSSNQGKDRLCAAHARFYYREHARDHRVDEDRKLVFTFLHERGLNYASVGRVYRRYLLTEGGVPTLRAKCKASPPTDYFVSAYWARPMLALKRYCYINNPNRDGKGILDVYLTCDQLGDELRRWKKTGVVKAVVQIVGANSEGHDGNHPTYFPLEPKVGGEEGFKRLITTIRELGYRSSVHVNIRAYAKPAPDFLIENVLRDRDGGAVSEGSGPTGDNFHACPAVAGPEFARRNFGRLKALGLDGGLYTDFIGGILFRCYHPLHPLTRRGYLEAFRAYIKEAKRVFGAYRSESIIAPVLDLYDAVASIMAGYRSETMMRGAEVTARGLADESAPLQAVIFHGLVLYITESTCLGQKDPWARVLWNVLLGAKPTDENRAQHTQWDDLRAFEYRVLCQQMSWLQYEFIDNIEQHGALTRTVYSDGTVVWVNHGQSPAKAGGRKLPGRSFWVKPGKKGRKEIWVEDNPSLHNRPPAPFPDGSIWPDSRPREGVVMKGGPASSSLGMLVGKDFA